jgi:hypothetical protein
MINPSAHGSHDACLGYPRRRDRRTDRGDDMSQIEQLVDVLDRFRKALLTNDVVAMTELIADEYVGYDPRGNPQDKAMSIDAYQPGRAKLDTYDVDDVETRVIGDVGVIVGTGYIHGTYAGYEFEHRLRFLDLYINREGRWQLFLSQVTPLEKA